MLPRSESCLKRQVDPPQGILRVYTLEGIEWPAEAVMDQLVRLPRQLGAIIQSARVRQGMTQSELAGISGTQQKTISAIENGSVGVKLGTLLRVIASLDLDIKIGPRERGPSIEDVF